MCLRVDLIGEEAALRLFTLCARSLARARVQCFTACLLLARVQISEEFPYRLLFALPSFEAGLLTAFALVWPNQSLMGPAPKFLRRLRKIRHALREGSLLVVWRTSPNAFASEEHGSTC
jgi:hypothetical protein